MIDLKLNKLADIIINYSLKLEKGERIMINGPVSAKPLIKAIIHEIDKIQAVPFVRLSDEEITGRLLKRATDERLELETKWNLNIFEDLDANIVIDTQENDAEFSYIDKEIMQKRSATRRPWVDMVVNNKKWVILNWPTKAQAQKARMPFEDFFDFVIDASSIDYSTMRKDMEALSSLMSKTDKVKITGPGTDLSFSIKGIPNEVCAGENNLPDGEVFTAPVKDSVEGYITYNTPCPYHGRIYNGVKLEFEKGRIVCACSDNDSDKLNAIFDTDDGARYIGEFALGVNPAITRAFGNILFDEKICGSFHFTPGNAYENIADNGNRSSIHWDMVCIQTPEYGGGEIWFDSVLIRKDGVFVPNELSALDPR